MSTALNKVLIAVVFSGLTVIACDRPQNRKMAEEQSAEFAGHNNTRCALVDEQVFCAASRMREPIQQASFSAL